jgi:purine-binding chemotaxis protein CheW
MTHPDFAPRSAGPLLELLVFEVAGDEFALETRTVREVSSLAAGGSAGATGELHGRVIDLRARLGFAPSAAEQRLVIAHGAGRPVGLLVDRICEVLRLSAEMIAPPLAPAGIDFRLLAGAVALDDRVVLILSLATLAADPEQPGSLAA